MDDLPPWDDINPPMMGSARPPAPLPASLAPATSTEFQDQLTACLSLVAPVGMSEEAQATWLAVAWATLGHLPADLLEIGASHARKVADHHSKIVPAIIAETDALLATRRAAYREDIARQSALPPPTKRDVMDRRGEAMSPEDTAELNDRLERLGAKARYREDGSRYTIDQAQAA